MSPWGCGEASRRRGRFVSVVLLAVSPVGLVTACGGSGDGLALEDRSFRVERHTWGGMCPDGPCRSTWMVDPDGTWSLRTEADDRSGRLSGEELDELYRAAESTDLTEAPPTTRCEADADGRSVRYVWTVQGRSGSASSCEVRFDGADPLVATLEELVDDLATG